ncbi:NYN domain-containing protein [Fervidobacterium sp.]
MARVAVFVDGSNLYVELRRRGFLPVDMTALAWTLAGGRPASMRFYTAPFAKGHEAFTHTLQKKGWLVVEGRSTPRGEKGVDVGLAVDLVLAAAGGLYDRAVLISGDGDLVRAVEAARELGLEVVVAQFQDAIAQDLARVASEVRLLEALPWTSLRYAKEAVWT